MHSKIGIRWQCNNEKIIDLEGNILVEELLELAIMAEGYCYIHNTLSKAVLMTTELYLNGEHVATRAAGPEA